MLSQRSWGSCPGDCKRYRNRAYSAGQCSVRACNRKRHAVHMGTVRLTTTAETRWSYGLNLADGVSSLVMLGPATYQAEVEVVSNETGELALASGAPVNWLNAPRYVYDCRIGSAVTGGRISYTLTEKAEMIRDILFPASYNGALGIKTSLRRAMPLVVHSEIARAISRLTDRVRYHCMYKLCGRRNSGR